MRGKLQVNILFYLKPTGKLNFCAQSLCVLEVDWSQVEK